MTAGAVARPDRVLRARRVVLTLLTAEVAVLILTGIALYFFYRPSDVQAWNDMAAASRGVKASLWLRHVHRAAAAIVGPTVLAAALLVAADRSGPRWRRQWLVTGGLAVTAVAALLSGPLLPWDQLALWAVKVGTNLTGYEPIRGSQVRFVLIGGAEVAPSVVLRWLAFHAVTGGPVMAALAAAAWPATRRSRSAGGAPSNETMGPVEPDHQVRPVGEPVGADGSGRLADGRAPARGRRPHRRSR